MTIIDFIELSDDDIIDLSSDEETVQEVQIATQHRAMSLDRQGMFFLAGEGNQGVQAVFVAAGEGSQDVQTVFVAASEGRQEAAEPGHALEATALSMVMEKAPLVAASEGRQEASESGHALEATTVSLVTETPPLGPTSTTPKALTSEGGDAESVRVKRKYRKKNYHTDTPRKSPRLIQIGTSPVEEPAADHKRSRMLGPAEESGTSTDLAEKVVLALPHAGSTNCLRSPTSARFPGLTSTTPKAQSSEGGDTKSVSVKVKYRKNYHTDTRRRSPRLIQMGECCTSTVEEQATDHKRSRMLGPEEESAASADSAEKVVFPLPHARSTNCVRPPTSATFPSLISTSPKAVTSEGGDAKLLRVKAKHPERNYHILSLVREKSPLGTVALALQHAESPNCPRPPTPDFQQSEGSVLRRRRRKAGEREGETS